MPRSYRGSSSQAIERLAPLELAQQKRAAHWKGEGATMGPPHSGVETGTNGIRGHAACGTCWAFRVGFWTPAGLVSTCGPLGGGAPVVARFWCMAGAGIAPLPEVGPRSCVAASACWLLTGWAAILDLSKPPGRCPTAGALAGGCEATGRLGR